MALGGLLPTVRNREATVYSREPNKKPASAGFLLSGRKLRRQAVQPGSEPVKYSGAPERAFRTVPI